MSHFGSQSQTFANRLSHRYGTNLLVQSHVIVSHIEIKLFLWRQQSDQMARSFSIFGHLQHLQNLSNAKKLPKKIQNFAKYEIGRPFRKILKTLRIYKKATFCQIWSHWGPQHSTLIVIQLRQKRFIELGPSRRF